MTNIIEILKGLGIDVPAEKQTELNKQVAENYKTVVEFDKKVSRLETERDDWKSQAETSAETLKGFEGKDFDAIQNELEAVKSKLKTANEEHEKQLYERDFADALDKEIANVKFTSESAKKAVMDEIRGAGLKLSDNKILGLNDLIAQIKTRDASAFVDEQQEQLEQSQPKFTQPIKNTSNGGVTKESIMAIKDRAERQKAMLENKSLFGIE